MSRVLKIGKVIWLTFAIAVGGTAVALAAGLVILVLFVPPVPQANNAVTASSDSCKSSEADVRQFWVSAAGMSTRKLPNGQRDDIDRNRITADLVRQSESLCRERRDMRPTPLPPNIQQLVR